ANTGALLHSHQTIWCPPPGLAPWPGTPQPGDRLWLAWRQQPDMGPTVLLGGGRVLAAPRQLFGTQLLWTNPHLRGLAAAAVQVGYQGPVNMSFLRLDGPAFPPGGPAQTAGLGQLCGFGVGWELVAASRVRCLIHGSAPCAWWLSCCQRCSPGLDSKMGATGHTSAGVFEIALNHCGRCS